MKKVIEKVSTFSSFVIVLFVLFLTVQSCNKGDDDDNSSSNQSSYLESITVTEYEWKFGEVSQDGELYEKYTYNPQGKLTKFTSNYYSSYWKGRIEDEDIYDYNEKGQLCQKTRYLNFGITKIIYKCQCNEFDSIAKIEQYDKDGKLDKTFSYEYDNAKRLIKLTELQPPLVTSSIWSYVSEYTYTPNLKMEVKSSFIDEVEQEKKDTTIWKYDAHNNLLEKYEIVKGKEIIIENNTYEYDNSGRITRKTVRDRYLDNNFTYYDYFYNEDGTIDKIHVSYSFQSDQSDLVYTYVWK
ncbi:MAG: hypothetical protein IKP73_20770 [Bacteroidales bacterium]|nr:hypothetical protein [Bacteroidales bacterium]